MGLVQSVAPPQGTPVPPFPRAPLAPPSSPPDAPHVLLLSAPPPRAPRGLAALAAGGDDDGLEERGGVLRKWGGGAGIGRALEERGRDVRSVALVACLGLRDVEMDGLKACVAIESLTLDGCVGLGDGCVRAIGALSGLRRLSLKACKNVGRVGGLGRCSKLQALSLEMVSRVGDVDLVPVLRGCRDLRVLRVAHCFRLTSAAFVEGLLTAAQDVVVPPSRKGRRVLVGEAEKFKESWMEREVRDGLARFLEMDLRCTGVDDEIWGVLKHMLRLRCLLVGGSAVSEGGGGCAARALARLTDLRRFGMERTVLGDDVLEAVAEASPHLETLDAAYSLVTDMGVARYIGKMTLLVWLNLEESSVTDFALERFSRLTKLSHLDVADTSVSCSGVRALQPLAPALKSLNLSFTDVRGLAPLASLTSLEVLTLDAEQRIIDADMAFLAKLRLKELGMYAARITDDGLETLCSGAGEHTLRVLDLCCCAGVGDRGLTYSVTRLRELRDLDISQTGVSDAGVIAILPELSHLMALNLSHTDVTRIAVDATKVYTRLKRVSFVGCKLGEMEPLRAHAVCSSEVGCEGIQPVFQQA